MVVLVVLTETFLAAHRPDFESLDLASYRYPGVMSREVARSAILAFGDSLVKDGVLPRVIEERLGRSAFNLAVPGGMPSSSYILLRRVLEAGGRPDAVLVDFKSRNISFDPRWLAGQMSGLPTLRDSLELGLSYRDADFLTTLLLARTLTSYQARREIRSVIWRRLDPNHPLDFLPMAAYVRNWEQHQGGQVNEKNPRSLAPDGPQDLQTYLLPHWWPDRRSARHVVKFLTLAEAHHVPVYWLLPPMHPKLQAWRDEKRADADYERFVRYMQKQFPNLRVIDARHSGYGPDLFWDAVHLDGDGAALFTAQVADVLRERSSGTRWVALPRPRAGGPRRALEDMDQSRLAVRPVLEGRR